MTIHYTARRKKTDIPTQQQMKTDTKGRWLYLDHFGGRQHCRLLRENITIDSFEGDIAPWRRALLSDVEADRTTQEVVPITKVIVEDGITGIGTDAFSYLALNGTITFNENVTYYGSGVYSYCPLITTVDFTNFKPKNVSDYWIPGHEMLTGSAVPYGFLTKIKA